MSRHDWAPVDGTLPSAYEWYDCTEAMARELFGVLDGICVPRPLRTQPLTRTERRQRRRAVRRWTREQGRVLSARRANARAEKWMRRFVEWHAEAFARYVGGMVGITRELEKAFPALEGEATGRAFIFPVDWRATYRQAPEEGKRTRFYRDPFRRDS